MGSSRIEDEQLLRALYASHGRPLMTYVQRLLGGDRQRAEDIVQETLLRAWQHAADLNVEQARPWLFTVAPTSGHRPEPTSLQPAHGYPAGTVDDMSTSEDELDAGWMRACRGRARRSTPPHREVLVESFYVGRTTREIAGQLSIPDGTVRSRLFYALQALRLALLERGVQQL